VRRIVIAVLTTVSGLVMLFSYHTSTNSGGVALPVRRTGPGTGTGSSPSLPAPRHRHDRYDRYEPEPARAPDAGAAAGRRLGVARVRSRGIVHRGPGGHPVGCRSGPDHGAGWQDR